MKALTLIICLCLNATPVFAQGSQAPAPCTAASCYRGAPAPLLGLGIPSALAVGGVLLGANLLRRRQR